MPGTRRTPARYGSATAHRESYGTAVIVVGLPRVVGEAIEVTRTFRRVLRLGADLEQLADGRAAVGHAVVASDKPDQGKPRLPFFASRKPEIRLPSAIQGKERRLRRAEN